MLNRPNHREVLLPIIVPDCVYCCGRTKSGDHVVCGYYDYPDRCLLGFMIKDLDKNAYLEGKCKGIKKPIDCLSLISSRKLYQVVDVG